MNHLMTIAVKSPSPILYLLQALDVSGKQLDFLEQKYRAAGRMIYYQTSLA